MFAGEPTRLGKGGEAFGGTLARPREASNDFDEGAEEAGWRDGHEAEVARAQATVGEVGGEAPIVGLMGAEGVAGGGAARDEEAADGVGVHHAATELDGHEAHRVAEVELDEGVDGRGAVRPAVDEHVDAEEAAVDAADGVAERVGDGRAEAVEKGAAEDVGQLPSEPVGVSESGAGEGSARVRVEDREAGVGDATVAVAVKLQGEVCRFVQLRFDADHPPSTEGALDPTPLWISDRSVLEGENPTAGAGEGGLEHKG